MVVMPVQDETKERFEQWAEEFGMVLDYRFFKTGNNYTEHDTSLAFEIWKAAEDSLCRHLGSEPPAATSEPASEA